MSARLYESLVLRRPGLPRILVLGLAAAATSVVGGCGLDADSESLTLEHDPDRDAYDWTRRRFGSDDYVIVALAPEDPWSRASLERVDALVKRLEALKEVDVPGFGTRPAIVRVLGPTNCPLFRSVPPGEAALRGFKPATLLEEDVDPARAREELTGSALYAGNLVSRSGDAFAILAYFAEGSKRAARDAWHAARDDPAAAPAAREAALAAFRLAADEDQQRVRSIVAAVREITGENAVSPKEATVFASGVPTIVVDMVNALEEDIWLFGVFAVGFMVVVLGFALRRVRWVVLPMLSVLVVALVVVAATVVAGKRTTVVTSNLSSLLLIVGMAHAIHIAVHYREIRLLHPAADVPEAVRRSVRGIAVPCLYACLTTAVGFGSIAVSDIRPCIDFGLFMAAGTLFAYLVSFTLIPSGMVLLTHEKVVPDAAPAVAPRGMVSLGRWTLGHGRPIVLGSVLVFLLSVAGVMRLEVETRFTDYFRASSPIARGLDFIDRRIGGTTPLEVVLETPEAKEGEKRATFLDEGMYAKLAAVHGILAGIPEGGTVLSLASLRTEGRKLLEGTPMAPLASQPLKVLLPMAETLLGKEEIRGLLRDYLSEDGTVARLQVRIRETAPTLARQPLLAALRARIAEDPSLADVRPRVTGMFVLYANMLRSLQTSQEQTLGMVVAALFLMLWVLFRDLRTALLALVPNVLPILFILGTMGWAGIPLDMMTIMIASVSMGMAVDATIHYTFRYRKEIAAGATAEEAVLAAHGSIGKAILYTALTVVGGFWVLVFSNFKPTIYFGMFTSLAMAAALLASLVLLPVLLRRYVREGSISASRRASPPS